MLYIKALDRDQVQHIYEKKKRKKKVVTVFPVPENLEAVKLRGLWVKINSVGGGQDITDIFA